MVKISTACPPCVVPYGARSSVAAACAISPVVAVARVAENATARAMATSRLRVVMTFPSRVARSAGPDLRLAGRAWAVQTADGATCVSGLSQFSGDETMTRGMREGRGEMEPQMNTDAHG